MNGPLKTVHAALEKAELLGTPYLPSSFRPQVLLQVKFSSTGVSAQLGNELTPAETKEAPVISFVTEVGQSNGLSGYMYEWWTKSQFARSPARPITPALAGLRHDLTTQDTDSTYAILSFDPDAPSREDQKFGPWRHLIQGGLKVKPESIEVTLTEEPLTPWVPPSPGQGTGPHRYCFALYKQTQPMLPMAEQSHIQGNERPERRTFKVADFAQQNGLELIGFNYFLCENP